MLCLNKLSMTGSWFAAATGLLCLVLTAGHAAAQDTGGPDLQGLAQGWLKDATASVQSSGATKLRLDVKIGSLDSRLKLAPCANVEPYLPAGARLWGHTRVGLRCIDGMVRWNVSLPVTVNAYGTAWVIKGPVAAGSPVTQDDVMESEVNWAEESSPILRDQALWLGQAATRQLMAGQALRQGMVRPVAVFQAGAPVRVLAQGTGFEVSSDAQALSAGVVGQVARVRMENGRVSSGVVLDARTVKIDL